MRENIAERIVGMVTEVLLVAVLAYWSILAPELRPAILLTVGGIVGARAAARGAHRVAVAGGTGFPPAPPTGFSHAPPGDEPPRAPPSALMARGSLGLLVGGLLPSRLARVAAAAVGAVALGVFIVDCSRPPPPTPDQIVFAAELRACVELAETREESRACRADVERRFAPLIEGAQKGKR